jgi:hypothetical protein
MWPFDKFKTSTVYHVKSGKRGAAHSGAGSHKGHAIYRRADGFTVPSLDTSVFDDKRQAKRFIDAVTKHNPWKRFSVESGGRSVSGEPRYFVRDGDTGMRVGQLFKKKTSAIKYAARRNRTAKNPTLSLPKNKFVSAKVRLKGGKLQVLVSESVLGHAGVSGSAGLSGVSVKGGAKLNRRRTKRRKR